MSIPSYKDWKKETSAIGKPRSKALQELDKAIEAYEKTPNDSNRVRVWTVLNYWKRQNKDWKNSVRNRTHIVDRLDRELDNINPWGMLRPEEKEALKYVMEQRKLTITKLFKNKEVSFKVVNLVKELHHDVSELSGKCSAAQRSLQGDGVGEIGLKWQNNPLYQGGIPQPKFTNADGYYPTPHKPSGKVKIGTSGYGMTPDGTGMGWQTPKKSTPEDIKYWLQEKVENGVKQLFEVERLTNLGPLTNLVLSIVKEVCTGIAPVIGHVKDGVDMVSGWVEVGVGFYKKHSISERKYAIELGHPEAAFRALEKLLVDEIAKSSGEAAMATASFAIKTGLAFTDFGVATGPIVGAIKAVAEIIYKLTLLAIEWRATVNVNQALANGVLDIRLFETYPLMGCYMLVCADLSDMIPIDNFGMPGWMDAVERLKKKGYDKILESAEDFIKKSPWEIKGMPKRKTETSVFDVLPGGGTVLGSLTAGVSGANLGFEGREFAELPDKFKELTKG